MARHFGVGVEAAATYGTPVVPTEFSEAISETLRHTREFETIEVIRSASPRIVNELKNFIEGDVVTIGEFQSIGLLLRALFGGVDSTATAPYTHTFPPSTGVSETIVSLTVEIARDTQALTTRYAGCIVTGLSINATVDQSPQLTWTFVGKSSAEGSWVASPSFPTLDAMLVSQVTVNVDASAVDASSLDLSISWPVDRPHLLGASAFGKTPARTEPLSVTGSFTVVHEDTTEWAKYDGSTDVDVQIVIDTGGDEIMTINMNKCRITAASANLDGRARLEAVFEFESFYDTDATENIQILLTNDDAAIPAPA